MEKPRMDDLAERFENRLVVLRKNLEILEKLRTPPKAPSTGLLSLPLELRLQIYHYCIPRKRIVEVAHPRFEFEWPSVDHTLDFEDIWGRNKNKNSILLLSKQISDEALDVLYGDNVFKLYLHGEGEYYMKKNFSDRNRQRIRDLLLIAQPRGISYTPGTLPDDALWRSTLPHLKILQLVLGQPVEAGGYYNAPTLEQDLDRWIDWIRPFLQCFGQHLSIQTKVEIDMDGRAETGALIKKYLPHDYREVRCRLVGDFIFKRGQYSWGSGYWDDDGPMNSHDADGDCGWGSD
jgi:hypothetical protein